jgi:hypothetical protein
VLALRDVSRADFELAMAGVEAFHTDDLREGNIILELEVVTKDEPAMQHLDADDLAEIMERLFPGPHESAASKYHEDHSMFLARQLARVASGSLTLVVIEPAYGADLVAACETATLRGPL